MMKKGVDKAFVLLLSALFIVLLSHAVAAADIHDGWHFSGDTFTVEGDVYTVTHYDFYETRVVLGVNTNTYIIEEGDCKAVELKEYCITEIYRNIENATATDHIKFEGGKPYAGIHIVVKSRGPDIVITRTFSNTTPELNQEVTITVTVENKAILGTDSFLYQETLPSSNVIITSVSEADRSGQNITYSKNIPAETKKTFFYSFKVTDYINFSTQPKARFTYSGRTTNVSVTSQTIKVARPYELTTTVSPSSVEANDQLALSLNVKNTVSSAINVSELKITIPSWLLVQSKPGELEKQGENYYWQGPIETAKYKLINLLLTPLKSGTYNVIVSLKIKDQTGKDFNESKNLSIKSTIAALTPILSVIETSVSEGGNYRIAFSVGNLNKKVGFKNIKASIRNDELFPEMQVELAELAPNETKTLLVDDTLIAPFLEDKKIFGINASGSYDTSTNEHFNFSKKIDLTVTPVSDVITIIQEADKKIVRIGENVTITIRIKNNNQEAIQVDAYDQYSGGVSLIGGMTTSDTIFFEKAETQQAYTYKLQIPEEYSSQQLVIITYANILEKSYSANKTLNISVNTTKIGAEKKPEPAQNKTEPPPAVVKQPEKKPGFFKRLIDSVTNFFRRLLGK